VNCEQAVERLPWLLNGSLPEDEHHQVVAHLQDCARCRAELASTRAAWELFAAHPASAALVDYAFDRSVAEPRRGAIESHLVTCATCRDEVARVRAAEGVGIQPLRALRPGPSGRRWLALAAGLFAAAGLGFVLGRGFPPRPTGAPAVHELEPEGRVERGAVAPERGALRRSTATILLLNSADVTPFDGYRVEVRGRSDEVAWSSDAVTRLDGGGFLLLLPADRLPPGAAVMVLLGRRGAESHPIERYELRVTP
jgi:hypothetical protein